MFECLVTEDTPPAEKWDILQATIPATKMELAQIGFTAPGACRLARDHGRPLRRRQRGDKIMFEWDAHCVYI